MSKLFLKIAIVCLILLISIPIMAEEFCPAPSWDLWRDYEYSPGCIISVHFCIYCDPTSISGHEVKTFEWTICEGIDPVDANAFVKEKLKEDMDNIINNCEQLPPCNEGLIKVRLFTPICVQVVWEPYLQKLDMKPCCPDPWDGRCWCMQTFYFCRTQEGLAWQTEEPPIQVSQSGEPQCDDGNIGNIFDIKYGNLIQALNDFYKVMGRYPLPNDYPNPNPPVPNTGCYHIDETECGE
jgi:hypothetical protein